MKNKISAIGIGILVLLWLAITGFAWFGAPTEISVAERRPLKQWPGISTETVLDGTFMTKFEAYTLDQFPLRDDFRTVKSIFHYNVMQQMDNNDIYIVDDVAAKLLYPLDDLQIKGKTTLFTNIYRKNLNRGKCNVYAAIVPDKSYYLAEANGYLAMDYEALFAQMKEGMPWATHIDITDVLDITDYYHTDTHWRQEEILPVAQKLSEAMGVTPPKAEDFTPEALEQPFYGVYYGQAALPMEPETMYLMQSEVLSQCRVYDVETQSYTTVYDLDKLTDPKSYDMYDVFLSGARALLRIENPNAASDRHLIIFRDSFGSSIAPLLATQYASVTLVDLRYVSASALDKYIIFNGQDVLFLYNTQVLNTTPLKP